MKERVISYLAPVRRRQRCRLALQLAVYGLGVSSCFGVGLGAWRWLANEPVAPLAWALLLAAGPALGAILGLAAPRSWRLAALAMDENCRLKDRALTALEFASESDDGSLHELQLRDAERHLTDADPRQAAPLERPRLLAVSLALAAAALVLCVWPLAPQPASANIPIPEIGHVADDIDNDVDELEKLAREQENEEIDRLVEQLREKTEEMKQPEVDVREALAALSEMQEAIRQQQAKYNEALVDAHLQSAGGAMGNAAALQAIGQQLQKGQFEKAAQELEQLEQAEMTRREAKNTGEELKKTAAAMGAAGLGQLSSATSELAEGVGSGVSSKTKSGSRRMARAIRKHQMRKHINRMLSRQLDRLSDCKSRCQACQLCSMCNSRCGGNCRGKNGRNSFTLGRSDSKSDQPKQNFGMATNGNLAGEKKLLLSQRNLETVTGAPGDGPSEVETTTSPEGRQKSQRAYREAYDEYQKLSEEVLDSEPIPLGHRQTIRRYFELIRPEGGGDTATE